MLIKPSRLTAAFLQNHFSSVNHPAALQHTVLCFQHQRFDEKRAKAWEAAKAFLESKRGADVMMSAEDTASYDKMEADVVNLGKEIERLER